MTSIAISETKHGNPQKTEQEETKKGDQDDVLPAKRKRSTNERAAASNGFTSSKENTTSQGEPSITASLQRKAKRTAVVKNPKKGITSSREQSPGSDQGGISSQGTTPFGKKQSAATHQPNPARENYVNQDDLSQGVMST